MLSHLQVHYLYLTVLVIHLNNAPVSMLCIYTLSNETVSDFIFGGSKITAIVIAAMKLKDAYPLESYG